MGFSLAGFIGGASQKLTDVIEAKEEEILEAKLLKEEREWQDSQYKTRLSLQEEQTIATETRARNQQVEDAMGTLNTLYKDKDFTANIAKKGLGAIQSYITLGNQIAGIGGKPMSYIRAHDNNIDAANKTLQNIKGTETEAAIPTTSYDFDFEKLAYEKQLASFSGDLDGLLSFHTTQLNKAEKLGDKTKIEEELKNYETVMKAVRLADPDEIEQVWSNPDSIVEANKVQALNTIGEVAGEFGIIAEELEGTTWKNPLTEYLAGVYTLRETKYHEPERVKDVTDKIKGMMEGAILDLYASHVDPLSRNFIESTERERINDTDATGNLGGPNFEAHKNIKNNYKIKPEFSTGTSSVYYIPIGKGLSKNTMDDIPTSIKTEIEIGDTVILEDAGKLKYTIFTGVAVDNKNLFLDLSIQEK